MWTGWAGSPLSGLVIGQTPGGLAVFKAAFGSRRRSVGTWLALFCLLGGGRACSVSQSESQTVLLNPFLLVS